MKRWRALLFALALAPLPANADPLADLAAAQALLAQAEGAEARLAALGHVTAAQEAAMTTLRANLRMMAVEQRTLTDRLGAADGATLHMLGGLERVVRMPRGALLAHPGGPVAAIRATLAAGFMAEEAARRGEEIRATVRALDILADQRRAALLALGDAISGLNDARREIAAALAVGRPPPPADPPADLQALAERLAEAQPEPIAGAAQQAALTAARGRLPLPAIGEARAEGFGLVLSVPPWAVIRSPMLATVRFAGTLRPLGDVVVLEPAPGAMIVLHGLGESGAPAGSVVQPMQPVGQMEGVAPDVDHFLFGQDVTVATQPQESLYIEIWRNGRREDAADWFALDQPLEGRLQ
jgi:septal ring factor EnvC (AmiA/AmiB activator)